VPREIPRPDCLDAGISAIIPPQATGGEPAMSEAAEHSAIEALRDGRRIEIRALKPEDRDGMVAAFDRVSAQSRQRRFFSARRTLTEKEIAFFLNVDFVDHVALVAAAEEGGKPAVVGGGRYIVVEPGRAEIAFAVLDQYQGQGIGAALMRHLLALARRAGLKELVAEVLPENAPMLKVFKRCGLPMTTKREAEVVHVTLQLS
jgi:GNAT superfamily N-acetyltransferase